MSNEPSVNKLLGMPEPKPEPIYWLCRWVTGAQLAGIPDFRCLDGKKVEVSSCNNLAWYWSERTVASCDSHFVRCNADGTPLVADVVDKPHEQEAASVVETIGTLDTSDEHDRPLQAGDWVELRSKPGGGCYETRTLQLSKLTWPRQITTVGDDGYVKPHGYDQWCNPQRFRRVPAPASDDPNPPSCKSCGVPWRDHLGPESQCRELQEERAASGQLFAEYRETAKQLRGEQATLNEVVEHQQSEIERLRKASRQLEDTSTEVRLNLWAAETQLGVLGKEIERLTRERDELRARDSEELDATDAAHPAWWRGHDHTAKVFCQLVNEILDGKDVSSGISGEPWQTTKIRVAALRKQLAEVTRERDVALAAQSGISDTLRAITAERNKFAEESHQLRKKLNEAEAEAAAMREAFSKRVTFGCHFWKGANEFYIRFHDARNARDCEHAIGIFLQGTAGRDLLYEMRRKDERIAELEQNPLASKQNRKATGGVLVAMADAIKRLDRKSRTAKAALSEAREQIAEQSPLVEAARELREFVANCTTERDGYLRYSTNGSEHELQRLLLKLRDAKVGA